LSWIALAGAVAPAGGKIVAYQPVQAWATGIGMMQFAA
jgi:hypothetical protein